MDSLDQFSVECGPINEDIESSRAKTDNPNDSCPSKSIGPNHPFPGQRFPPDVLIPIFLVAIDTALQNGTLTMSRTHPAVVASHVCHEWREVVLSAHTLWSHIHLVLPPYPWFLLELWGVRAKSFTGMDQKSAKDCWKDKLEHLQTVAQVWLSRSRNCLLSVDVGEVEEPHAVMEGGWPETEMADGLVHLDKIIDLLCDASFRWRDFKMSCTITPHTRRLLLVRAQVTPVLRSAKVAFGVCSWEAWQVNFLSSTRLLTAKSLRSLNIPNLMWQDILTIPVHWSSLTNLTFGGYQYAKPLFGDLPEFTAVFGGYQSLELLSRCPNLRRAELHVGNEEISWLREPVLLSSLEELTLGPSTSPFSLPIGFAPSLILPSLRKFTMADVESVFNFTPSAHNGLTECICQYGSTLTDITLCYMVLTPSALLDCLQNLPNILSLDLRGLLNPLKNTVQAKPNQASLSRELLVKLTPQFDESPGPNFACLCPRLREFRCSPNRGMLDELAFVEFVVGRRRTKAGMGARNFEVARIERVLVDCTGPPYLDTYRFEIDVEEELVRRGVDMDGFTFELLLSN